MASTEFKLCRRKGITRRVAFPQRPTWTALAARISQLYSIPLDRVAVSYIDADDDEVTLNTQEELMHFYQTCKPASVIKLFVQDLLALRSRPLSMPMEPIDDEWWRSQPWEGDAVFVPDLTMRSSQHGFVEEVDSDADAASKLSSRKSASSIDKGKGKAEIAKEADRYSKLSAGSRNSDTSTPALAESTPKQSFSAAGNLGADASASEDVHVIDDPPLPSIEPDAPSLPDDISNFFSSFCNVISSHPEVSESFRNIILNASNGTYWRAHREALSHAAAEVSQVSETVMQDVFHEGEAEAGRRVFNALDAVFRTISQATGVRRAGTEPNLNEAAPAKEDDEAAPRSDVPSSPTKPATGPDDKGSAEAQTGVPKQEQAPFVGRSTDWQSFLTPIFPPPPPTVHSPRAYTHPFMAHLRFPPVPPPPPPPPGLAFIPPPATGVPSPFPFPEAPSPPEPPRHDFPSPWGDEPYPGLYSGSPASTDPRVGEMAELRAKVHAAKSMYRAEKARYLQEREQARKREKGKDKYGLELNETGEMRAFEGLQSMIDANEGPVSQVISNARGSFPQLGMISIPGPFSPSHRHGSFREATDDFRSRAVKRICKQLADMGFSESQHPGLADKVSARLPQSVTKDVEDGILTSLLEELLPLTSPVASGSGLGSKRT